MSLTSVVEVLKKYFDWTNEDVARKEKELSFICYLKEKDILEKANFYKTTFGLTQPEFNKILKTSPYILGYNNDSVLEKANFYKTTFGLTQSEFIKMLKTLPAISGLKNDSVLDKVNFYTKTFELTQPEFNKILKIFPAILSYNNDSVLEKANFYTTTFGLTQSEFNKILKTLPTVLSLKNDSVLDKKKNFDKIGLDKNNITKQPAILTAPSNSLIFKYMLLYIDFGDKSFLDKRWFMTSERKTWARYAYLTEKEKAKPNDLLMGEKRFQKKYGVESIELMEKFPITKEVVEFVNSEYDKLTEINGDKKLEVKLEDLQKSAERGE